MCYPIPSGSWYDNSFKIKNYLCENVSSDELKYALESRKIKTNTNRVAKN
jgi:hypothetical protein